MRTQFAISIVATAILALSVGSVAAEPKGRVITGTPPHPSTVGRTERAPIANTEGANSPRFCPPGQRRKPGKGSAFNC